MNALPLPPEPSPAMTFAPSEVELESQFYLGWKLRLFQHYFRLSRVYNWEILDEREGCRERGTWDGEYEELEAYFHQQVNAAKLMSQLTTEWIFTSKPKVMTCEDFKENPQGWRDRCRLLHMIRELEKMKEDMVSEFAGKIEDMISAAKDAIACLDAEVTGSVAATPEKSRKKPPKN